MNNKTIKPKNRHSFRIPDTVHAEMNSYPTIFRQLTNDAGRGIIAHDPDGQIFFFNQEAANITGLKKKNVIGKKYHHTMEKIFGSDCFEHLGNHPFESKERYSMGIKTNSGKIRNIKITVSRINNGNGEELGCVACFSLNSFQKKSIQKKVSPLLFPDIVGQNKKMIDVFTQIQDVAKYDCPVHIFGETGTGKELVAQAIHLSSPRKEKPFVPINCGALPEGLIESELFGHVKGAFSGAIREKKGRLELANGGTVFLDEVAELSTFMQVKLLRFVQDGRFEKVGGEKTISVDVRLISATNKILKNEMKKNRFREDLFFRLRVFPINLPPLCEKKSDIPMLVQHFLHEIENQYNLGPIPVSTKAMSLLSNYKWPGNVRELQNALQFAFIKSHGIKITPENLPIEILANEEYKNPKGPSRKLNIETVKAALSKTGGNKAGAARYLGVGRATLYRFLDEQKEFR
jgi:PAS domain S-box-containing protein